MCIYKSLFLFTHSSLSHIYNEAKGKPSERNSVTLGKFSICYKGWPSDTLDQRWKKCLTTRQRRYQKNFEE